MKDQAKTYQSIINEAREKYQNDIIEIREDNYKTVKNISDDYKSEIKQIKDNYESILKQKNDKIDLLYKKLNETKKEKDRFIEKKNREYNDKLLDIIKLKEKLHKTLFKFLSSGDKYRVKMDQLDSTIIRYENDLNTVAKALIRIPNYINELRSSKKEILNNMEPLNKIGLTLEKINVEIDSKRIENN